LTDVSTVYWMRFMAVLFATGAVCVGALLLRIPLISAVVLFAAAVSIGESSWLLVTVGRCMDRETYGLATALFVLAIPAMACAMAGRISHDIRVIAAALLTAQIAVISVWAHSVSPSVTPRPLRWQGYLTRARHGVAYAISAALGWVYGQSDVVITSAMLGTAWAGTYYANYRLFAIAQMASIAASAHWGPRFFELCHRERLTLRAREFVGAKVRTVTCGAFVAGILLGSLGPLLTGVIFGKRFTVDVPVILILAAGLPASYASVVLGGAITGYGAQRIRNYVQAIAGLSNIALNIWLLRKGGIEVAAATTTMAGCILLALYAWFATRMKLLPLGTLSIIGLALAIGFLGIVAGLYPAIRAAV